MTCSITNCITKMFQISEAFLHLRETMCIFRQLTDFIHFPSSIHIRLLCWFTNKLFDIPKLKLCSIDPEYCMLFFSLFLSCHVIEDKCWKHSFKQSMRLKCTARKECIKYINKCIYLKSFVPKIIYTPCGNNVTEILYNYVDRNLLYNSAV